MININRYLTTEQSQKCVADCDKEFDLQLENIYDDLLLSRGRFHGQSVKAIALCGPTCAGKTTTAKKLTSMLESHGKRVHVLSIDDYYYDRKILKERSKGGEIDFDSPDTIDTKELLLTIREIFDDDENVVEVPTYDFKLGTRGEPRFIPVDDRDIFIFEGIQVFYPNVFSLLNSYPTTSVYINAMKSIQSGNRTFPCVDLRLYRRIVRDFYRREAAPEFTFDLWKTVRRNEDDNIFPYIHRSKIMLNSTMAYEIGMLKPYLDEMLSLVPKNSEHYYRSQDILESISDFSPISKEFLSPDSLFHEFV
jgi:uridine kinase